MKTDYVFDWDEETRTATCTIDDPRRGVFVGLATCHPDDADMCNKITGQRIALSRAMIKILTHIRDNEIKPELKALNNYLFSINKSAKFDKKHYAVKILYNNIKRCQEELETTQSLIAHHKEELADFISAKEELYQSLRKRRAAAVDEK